MSRSIHRRTLLRALCLPLLLVTIVACHRQDPSALNANELFFLTSSLFWSKLVSA